MENRGHDEALLRAGVLAAAGVPASSDYDLNPGQGLPPGLKPRSAAVLIPIRIRDAGSSVILTRRPDSMQHHPGQVAFPGGKIEPGDDGAAGAAIREADEEIGLPSEMVEVVGVLPCHLTVTGFRINPVVGFVEERFRSPRPSGEVEEVFEVPLAHVLSRSNYYVRHRCWQGRRRRYYVVPYGPHYVWGATARILLQFATGVEQVK